MPERLDRSKLHPRKTQSQLDFETRWGLEHTGLNHALYLAIALTPALLFIASFSIEDTSNFAAWETILVGTTLIITLSLQEKHISDSMEYKSKVDLPQTQNNKEGLLLYPHLAKLIYVALCFLPYLNELRTAWQ